MKKIILLYGGKSTEHEVSLLSAANITEAFLKLGKYEILPVYISKEGQWLLRETGSLETGGIPVVLSPDFTHHGLITLNGKLEIIPVDGVFPALHGKNGEDGSIQGLCKLAGLPCAGPGILSSALCMDKDYARQIVLSLPGIVSTPYLTFKGADLGDPLAAARKAGAALGYPCFVKPANAGSSVGVSKAADQESFMKAFSLAAAHDNKVLAEKAVNGRELETAVLGNNDVTVSGVGEILAGAEFYDYDAKYHSSSSEGIIQAALPETVASEVRRQAGKIYKALGCAGMARVDFFLEDKTDRVIFNEVNTIPGFTSISMYPKLFAAAGVSAPELVERLIELAFENK